MDTLAFSTFICTPPPSCCQADSQHSQMYCIISQTRCVTKPQQALLGHLTTSRSGASTRLSHLGCALQRSRPLASRLPPWPQRSRPCQPPAASPAAAAAAAFSSYCDRLHTHALHPLLLWLPPTHDPPTGNPAFCRLFVPFSVKCLPPPPPPPPPPPLPPPSADQLVSARRTTSSSSSIRSRTPPSGTPPTAPCTRSAPALGRFSLDLLCLLLLVDLLLLVPTLQRLPPHCRRCCCASTFTLRALIVRWYPRCRQSPAS